MARHTHLAALALLLLLAGASAGWHERDYETDSDSDSDDEGWRPRPGPHCPPGPPPPPEMVCKRDFFRFCAFRIPDMKNVEDIAKCMESHMDQLQPMCAKFVQNVTADLASFHSACDDSLKEVCPESIGKPETAPCMAFNLDKMEPVCLKELSKIMKKKADQKRPGPHGPHDDYLPGHHQDFAGDDELAGIEMMPFELSEGGPGREGRMHDVHKLAFKAGLAGGATILGAAALLMCCAHCIRRRRCHNHCHPHPGPHPGPPGPPPHHHHHPHPPHPHVPSMDSVGVEVGKVTDYKPVELTGKATTEYSQFQ